MHELLYNTVQLSAAVAIALRECLAASRDDTFDKIFFCCFDTHMLALYDTELAKR